MSTWVASLSADRVDNWNVCRALGLWGSGSSRAGAVRSGDELFVWQSGAGWLARCVAQSEARPAPPAEDSFWPDGATYRYVFDISVQQQLPTPLSGGSPKGVEHYTGLRTVQLGQFPALEEVRAARLRAIFGPGPGAGARSRVGAREPEGGWGRRDDRERNKRIEQAAIDAVVEELEGRRRLTLTADRQLDGVGYDLEFTNAGGSVMKAEVKGIAASSVTFNVTRLEWEVSQSDPAFRLFAVTDALTQPVIHELTGAQLAALNRHVVQYRLSET